MYYPRAPVLLRSFEYYQSAEGGVQAPGRSHGLDVDMLYMRLYMHMT